jgi:hypothetical protein
LVEVSETATQETLGTIMIDAFDYCTAVQQASELWKELHPEFRDTALTTMILSSTTTFEIGGCNSRLKEHYGS